ncbi:sigma-54-dependent Fis family transcriptional regulator [Azospirillum sp. RWY-5-1]|uniref:Sigma-54-dependent Fis family transcriptional regulator n=1 Tax=Azospirillum oleiclasticum TaxID=2735135 RepID=A0ABX2TGX2_9PROT|nr:sigma-54 dependent transcriptional regulator [Azospirillum oleiclasticum]NYZ14735.1 sigma-54-dependent Fis family transcriptional regulator [Azospirillum oleiclasticum]NYZ22279.1 sigma-54-dependent Fis family transcriptional regulator [Azospirillum oleiclasticum]
MTEPVRVVLIEDDPIMGESLVQRLTLEGFPTVWAKTGAEGLAALRRERPDAVISDIKLPDLSGEEVFRRALPELGGVPILFITAFGEIEQAVRLVRAGADDYLTKPFPIGRLVERLKRVTPRARAAVAGPAGFARSDATRRVEQALRRVGPIDSTVLLTGETGTGKEVAARFLHAVSDRADKPFVAVNCAAIPPELMDSQVFGHERGAFTGAQARHIGFAEQAEDGMLFLDEVAELPLAVQAKLLRLLQERSFTRVGGTQLLEFRARVVCATNADLTEMIRRGGFREDLYYRIHVIALTLPPLRDRREEILPLAAGFVAEIAARFGRPEPRIGDSARLALLDHPWPGNVRELRNRIERAVALGEGDGLEPADLFPELGLTAAEAAPVASLSEVRDEAERRHILAALDQTGGQIARAASQLGVSRTTLWEKMRRLGIDRKTMEDEP